MQQRMFRVALHGFGYPGQIPPDHVIGEINGGDCLPHQWPSVREGILHQMRAKGYRTEIAETRDPNDGRVHFIAYGFRLEPITLQSVG